MRTYPDGHTEICFTSVAPFETAETLDRLCEILSENDSSCLSRVFRKEKS